MPIGIDISQDAIRIYTNDKSFKHYGVIGITPQWNEPVIWTNPRTVRSSVPSLGLSFSDIFNLFREDQNAVYRYKDLPGNDDIELPTTELITNALIQHIPRYSEGFSILCVDNTLSEFHQTELLKSIGQKGFGKRELLWRPIALCLDHISSAKSPEYTEGDKILIVDFDSLIPELTELEMREHREALIPRRSLPENLFEQHQIPGQSFSTRQLLDDLISEISGTDPILADQLRSGPFAKEFMHFLNHDKDTEIWIRKDLDHEKMILNQPILDSIRNKRVEDISFNDIQRGIEQIVEERDIKTVLWNGLLPRIQTSLKTINNYVLPENASSRGAQEYGRRILAREPTYLDTLPGLEILSLEKRTGSHKFFTVIPAGEAEGGQKVSIPEPLTKFKLEEGTEEFTAILRNPSTDTYKRLITKLPAIGYDGENIPLSMDAETQPAQGHAKVTIEGVGDQLELFGPQRLLELDWDSGEDIKIEDIIVYKYNGPEVYPVRGRIADDKDCLKAAKLFAKEKLQMNSQVPFRGSQVSYARVHEPWGYNDPFGNRMHKEPTRALFGAFLEEDPDIQKIANKISKQIYATVQNANVRFKYLNYMFRYAPEKFRDELRSLYAQSKPDLNWNTVYAVGRTFYSLDDFELFVDFLLKHSRANGYPEYTDESFTKIYFWSYFRALCFYEDPVGLPIEKAEKVLKTVYKYTIERNSSNWRVRSFERGRNDVENLIKYILSTILFSIRFRKKQPSFLGKDTKLHGKMVEVITEMTWQIEYPKTMFQTRQPDKLNDYVLRFLNDEQTEKDLGVLKGLVVE
jgi:hypothetical protein